MLKTILLGIISWLLIVISVSSILTMIGVGNMVKSIVGVIISIIFAFFISNNGFRG